MEVLCIRENPKWKKIDSGRIYYALSVNDYFLINNYKIDKKELLIHFKIL